MGVYRFVHRVEGEDVEGFIRGKSTTLTDAIAKLKKRGVDPFFVECLRGGEPGYWSKMDEELNISQTSFDF